MDRRSFLLGAVSIPVAGSAGAKAERTGGAGSFPVLRDSKPQSIVYIKPLDVLRVIHEDCSWREDCVDGRISLLWHPYEERLVGFQLRDAHGLCEKLLYSPLGTRLYSLLLVAMNALDGEGDERLLPYMRALVLFGVAEIPEDVLFHMSSLDQDLPIVVLDHDGPVPVQQLREKAAKILMGRCLCGARFFSKPLDPEEGAPKCPTHSYGGEWKIYVQKTGHDWVTNGKVPYPDSVLLLG